MEEEKQEMLLENIENNEKIDFSLDENYFATSGEKSKDLYIYDTTTREKLNMIQAHTLKDSIFYFVDNNKAFTLTGHKTGNYYSEIIYWNCEDLKNFKQIFTLENQNLRVVFDS